MPQEFLNRAQVSSFREQVGGVGVAQGVRGQSIGQAECQADFFHLPLDNPRA